MNFYNFIKEEYEISVPYGKEYYEVFVNPDTREIQKLKNTSYGKVIRILYDRSNNDIYMFNSNLLHDYVIRTLKRGHLNRGYFTIEMGRDVLTFDAPLPTHKNLKKLVEDGVLLKNGKAPWVYYTIIPVEPVAVPTQINGEKN